MHVDVHGTGNNLTALQGLSSATVIEIVHDCQQQTALTGCCYRGLDLYLSIATPHLLPVITQY